MIVTHRVHLQPIGNFFSWPYTKSRHTFLAIVSVGTSCMSVPHVMHEMQSMQVYLVPGPTWMGTSYPFL